MRSRYLADMFNAVTFREAVRTRPGMYVGSVDDGAGPLPPPSSGSWRS